jgi:hypothetical protein
VPALRRNFYNEINIRDGRTQRRCSITHAGRDDSISLEGTAILLWPPCASRSAVRLVVHHHHYGVSSSTQVSVHRTDANLGTGGLTQFCRTHLTVLDCANGYQKEEVDEGKEDRRPEGEADQEANAEK